MRRDVQALITEGVQLVWDSYKLDPYVQRLAEAIFLFQERVDDLLAVEERIDLEVKAIDTCAYNKATFAEVLARVQKYVDDLSLHQYSNLLQWVSRLDHEVSQVRLIDEWFDVNTDILLCSHYYKYKVLQKISLSTILLIVVVFMILLMKLFRFVKRI